MKNHRFLWLRNRTTDNRKCEKARNIKEKRTIEMFSTVSKPLVVLHSSQRDNYIISDISRTRRSPTLLWVLFFRTFEIQIRRNKRYGDIIVEAMDQIR